MTLSFSTPLDKLDQEEGAVFAPKFDANGLIPCITLDAETGKVLMMAYMNDLALKKSLETGEVHYWSRSRSELWHKGATSGQIQKIIRMQTDCDQDCILMHVEMPKDENGDVKSCHTGRESCFYRDIILEDGKPILKKPSS